MAAATKRPPANDKDADSQDERKAPSVGELEEEMLGPKGAQKGGKEKGEKKAPAVGKGGGKLKLALLISLFWLAIFSVLLLLVTFDPTEDKTIREKVFLLLDPELETFDEIYYSDILDLQDWERELNELNNELTALSDQLDQRNAELDELESELIDKQDTIDSMLEALGEGATVNEIAPDPQLMAETLAKMPPADAARQLEMLETEIAARVCLLMKATKLAPILAAMDPDLSNPIVELLSTPLEIESE